MARQTCPECGTENRVAEHRADLRPVCGKCGATLGGSEEQVNKEGIPRADSRLRQFLSDYDAWMVPWMVRQREAFAVLSQRISALPSFKEIVFWIGYLAYMAFSAYVCLTTPYLLFRRTHTWLKDGYWPNDTIGSFTGVYSIPTEWIGVNKIIGYFLTRPDWCLGLLAFWPLLFVGILIARSQEDWK